MKFAHSIIAFVLSLLQVGTTLSVAQEPQRIGAPTQFFVDSERYRFGHADMNNPAFYPIPNETVTRDTYMQYLESLDLEALASNPNRGDGSLVAFMPVLVKYAESGEKRWADACVEMLKQYHTALKKRVEQDKWIWDFEWPAVLFPLYRQYLMEGGIIEANTSWFKDLVLYYCRNLHVWAEEPIEWRGGCHRSVPEGTVKWLASTWYPDIPEAEHWARYGQLVFNDFWKVKDVPQNDTGYMMGPLLMPLFHGDRLLGDDRVYTDPGMQQIFTRIMMEVSSDGAVNPYGPNGGYNSTAHFRVSVLERIAAKTGDGRYRYVAHKLINYLRYQAKTDNYLSSLHASLAYLFADDSITPVAPEPDSIYTMRNEAMRVAHKDKALTEKLLGNADPRENRGFICCSWVMNEQQWPDKFIFRSGWNPGDFFCLVELHPTSFPANPGGIMGMNRYGAPFTQIVTSKGSSEENRLLIQDIDRTTERRLHPDKGRIDENWAMGNMPDIRSEVTHFEDTPEATYAKVKVQNPDGLPVIYEREFIFAKNRFLATREMVTFEESFLARISPLWNTQNIGPQLGNHWANTFMSAPVANNGRSSMKTPPVDLLVWFAPQEGCRLQVVDRMTFDARTTDCPAQLRYTWEGTPKKGEQKIFTQIYYPHMPYRNRTYNNNPGAKEVEKPTLQNTAYASGIEVIRDDANASILKLEFEKGKSEYVVFNPAGHKINMGDRSVEQAFAYFTEPKSSNDQ